MAVIIAACCASSLGFEARARPLAQCGFQTTLGKSLAGLQNCRQRHVQGRTGLLVGMTLDELGQNACAGDDARTVRAFVDEGEKRLLLLLGESDGVGRWDPIYPS